MKSSIVLVFIAIVAGFIGLYVYNSHRTVSACSFTLRTDGSQASGKNRTSKIDTGTMYSFSDINQYADDVQITSYVFSADYAEGITEGAPRYFPPDAFHGALNGNQESINTLQTRLQVDTIDRIKNGLIAYASSTFGGGARIDLLEQMNVDTYQLTEVYFMNAQDLYQISTSTLESFGLSKADNVATCNNQ
jgi:hypothetical protein